MAEGSEAVRPPVGSLQDELVVAYLGNLVFAWTYNVGDVHVFFLPSHYIVALCAGDRNAFVQSVPGTRTSSTNTVRPVTWATPS